MRVIKRDGKLQEFDKEKIRRCLELANSELEEEDRVEGSSLTKLVNAILGKIAELTVVDISNDQIRDISVEEIQDIVENELIRLNKYKLAKHYIKYRYQHQQARDKYSELMNLVRKKLTASDVENQNANIDENSFGGRIGESSSAVNKKFALDFLLSDLSKNNHLNNEIYIHDLDHYAVGDHNCMSLPLDDLLAKGFNVRQTDIRPAGSLNTAFQLVAVCMQLQSLCQFGGVSATHLDWTMVPYVRKSFYKHYKDGLKWVCNITDWDLDNIKPNNGNRTLRDLISSLDDKTAIDDNTYKSISEKCYDYALEQTKKECHQAVEGMYHNLNSLQSRSGCQVPFSSINYGTCTLPEGRMVIEELLNVSIEGLGKLHRTSIFPCGIFQYAKGINDKPGTPNYDMYRLALKSTAKRLYPNYANIDWSGNAGYDKNDPKTFFSTMGCRTANGADINAEDGVNPQTKDGRGNICPVTIILPTIAMEADGDVNKFFDLLDKKIHEAKDMLLERFEWICSQSPKSAQFMYENNVMLGYHENEGIRSALKHGTLVIGQLGLAETLQILIGCDHTDERGMELAKRIEQLFKDRCAEFKKSERLNFGVYYTPAENLCYTAMKKFQNKYGIIKNVSDHEFFTNSMHVPVWKELSPFDKIDIESELTDYSNAGCITYVEIDGGVIHNIDALETLVNYAMSKDIPYFAVNVPNDTCLDCGFTGEFNDHCQECGSKNIQQLRRVTGYLTGNYKTAFNLGKQQEVEYRTKHGRGNI